MRDKITCKASKCCSKTSLAAVRCIGLVLMTALLGSWSVTLRLCLVGATASLPLTLLLSLYLMLR